MARSAISGIGPAELSLVQDEQSAVAASQAAEVELAVVPSGQSAAAVANAQIVSVGLVADDPAMAAIGMLSGTMVAVSPAPKFDGPAGAFLSIAALPITTSRLATSRAAQLVTDLGLSDGLTVAATI